MSPICQPTFVGVFTCNLDIQFLVWHLRRCFIVSGSFPGGILGGLKDFFPLQKLGVISMTVQSYHVTVGWRGVVSHGHLLAVEVC